jgi:adenylate cyclase
MIVGLAGPTLAIGLVWSGCTVMRFMNETSERTRVTGRFRSYVDPTLVNYVIAHREEARLRPEVCELTVCFSDLAGFTALSEKLGRASVPLVSRYMRAMVPIIRAHRGYVNKFLGDGIMFFYGAPKKNPEHAADAVVTALEMQAAMGPFNNRLAKRGLPPLSMRIGICTGMMMVGDAGPPDASDYTVLGDNVNLGSRLEGVNKAFGSHVLMSARTAELLGERFLIRPIGKVCVVGKSEGIMTYEPLALREAASEAQQQLAKLTAQVVEAFMAGRFDVCLQIQLELEKVFGPSKFISKYRELCERYLKEPPGKDFDGQINLFEK